MWDEIVELSLMPINLACAKATSIGKACTEVIRLSAIIDQLVENGVIRNTNRCMRVAKALGLTGEILDIFEDMIREEQAAQLEAAKNMDGE